MEETGTGGEDLEVLASLVHRLPFAAFHSR